MYRATCASFYYVSISNATRHGSALFLSLLYKMYRTAVGTVQLLVSRIFSSRAAYSCILWSSHICFTVSLFRFSESSDYIYKL